MLRHTECPYRLTPVAGAKLSAVGTGYWRGSPLGHPGEMPCQIAPIDRPPID
jgi:hypothetical protein